MEIFMRTRFRPSTTSLAALGALCLLAIPSLLQLIGDPANALAPAQIVIIGPTAGRAICAEPMRSSVEKRAYCRLDGYQNTTGAPQQFAFPARFTEVPAVIVNSDPPAFIDRAGVTLPASMSEPTSSWILVGGF
jgi:hypothetical protein